MFTVKSVSEEGIYYLVNGWEKNKAFWIEPRKIKSNMLFSSPKFAKASLTKLLKIAPEYAADEFELIEVTI